MTQPVTHVHQIYIRTTPERLWRAITDGDETVQYFFGSRLTGPLSLGSKITYLRDGKIMTDGTVLEFDPPRKLVQTWAALYDDLPDPESKVTWEITPLGETCKLTVTHEHVAESAKSTGTLNGWPMVLSGLKTLVETNAPLVVTLPQPAVSAN